MRQTITAAAQDFVRRTKELRKQVVQLITTLPDSANGVTLLSKNCASVSLSTIAAHNTNLSPRYYITRHAKNALIKIVKTTSIEQLDDRIKRIVQTGRIFVSSGNIEDVSPEFRAALKKLWCGAE